MVTIEDLGKFVITGKKGKVKGICEYDGPQCVNNHFAWISSEDFNLFF